jgi:hypothetical protein
VRKRIILAINCQDLFAQATLIFGRYARFDCAQSGLKDIDSVIAPTGQVVNQFALLVVTGSKSKLPN